MKKVEINMDLSSLFGPGIYKITCITNQKVYIGESSNLLNRLGKHTDSLQNNRHDCLELQKDFNKYSKENFIFEVLEIDQSYENKQLREEREKVWIQQIPEEFRYNQLDFNKSSKSRAIRIRGQVYTSLSNAAKILQESKTNIIRKALNQQNSDYELLTEQENLLLNSQLNYQFKKSSSCVINGTFYKSLNKASQDLGIHYKTVKNRILSDKWPTYLFSNENDRSNDYSLEE
jgi:group I intron endonuclease